MTLNFELLTDVKDFIPKVYSFDFKSSVLFLKFFSYKFRMGRFRHSYGPLKQQFQIRKWIIHCTILNLYLSSFIC